MGRKKKLVNNTTIPQYVVERFARCVFDDIRADYAKPEVQADFQRWLAEREENKKTRAAKSVALVSFCPSVGVCLFYNTYSFEKSIKIKRKRYLYEENN